MQSEENEIKTDVLIIAEVWQPLCCDKGGRGRALQMLPLLTREGGAGQVAAALTRGTIRFLTRNGVIA